MALLSLTLWQSASVHNARNGIHPLLHLCFSLCDMLKCICEKGFWSQFGFGLKLDIRAGLYHEWLAKYPWLDKEWMNTREYKGKCNVYHRVFSVYRMWHKETSFSKKSADKRFSQQPNLTAYPNEMELGEKISILKKCRNRGNTQWNSKKCSSTKSWCMERDHREDECHHNITEIMNLVKRTGFD